MLFSVTIIVKGVGFVKKIFIFWLVLFPIISLNGIFEGTKVVWLWLGSVPLFAIWVIKLKDEVDKILTKADYVYFLWLLLLIVSSIFGVHPQVSIIGGSYRHQGVIFFLSLWVIRKTIGLLSENDKKLLVKLFLVGGIFQSLLLISQKFIFATEPLGTFGNSKAASGYIALTLLLPSNLSWVPKSIIYLIAFPAIILSRSATGTLVAISSILKRKLFFAVLTLLAVGALIVGGNMNFNDPYEGRGVIWRLAIQSVKERPILGYGAESGEIVFKEAFRVYGTPLEGLIVDRAHNIFFDIAMWSGVFGLILFIYWIYLCLKGTKEVWRKKALLGFFVFASLQPLGVVHWIMLVVFISL